MTKISNVRKTTKFKRSIKAISPVIATLLMIAIAVVASLVVYAWVTGYIGGTTNKAGQAIQIQSFAPTGTDPLNPTNLLVYVQNVGQGDVQLNQDQSVYIGSNLVTISAANPTPTTWPLTLSVGQTVELTVPLPSGYQKGDKLDIKITTTDGTFMTTTGTGTGTSSANPTAPPGAVATKLAFSAGGAQSLTVNVVSGAIVVQRQDASNNPVATGTSQITVALSSSGTGTFYSDAAGTNAITSVTIAAGQSDSAGFYYKATVIGSGTHTLTGASGTLTSATTSFTISAANPVATKLAFSSGGAQSLTVNVVSGAIVVQRQDASNNPVATGTSQITVALSSSGTGTFYSDAAGTNAITTINIVAGTSDSAGFYYKATAVGSGTHTLTGASGTLTSATTSFTISAANPVATKLVFSAGAPQTLTAGVVSPTAIVVQRQDASNNPVSTGTSAITVTLTTGSAGGRFYSDAGGTTQITTISIPAGASSSAGFYYKDTVASAARTLTGASGTLTSATSAFTINAAAASKLVWTVVDSSVPRNARSTVFTVQRQDQYNNPTTTGTITLTLDPGSGSAGFYATSSSNTIITTINISAGSSSADLYWQYNGFSTSSRTLTAASGTLTTASVTITVT